jgi:predicted TIM-barrel fold metal-dependent hydrolase
MTSSAVGDGSGWNGIISAAIASAAGVLITAATRAGPPRSHVYRCLGISDGADPHHRGDDGAGVFERYPRLRVSFGESGAGWLAYALHRMDFEFEDRFRDLMKLKLSEYWRRQCKATFQFDPISAKLIDDIGVETMMWGSDYPHTDGIWPESSKYIEEQFAGLSPEIVHKITCENAAKFYNLIN